MNLKVLTSLIQVATVVLYLLVNISPSIAGEHCLEPVGRLVSLQGDAQQQHAGQSEWQPVGMNAEFCPGDIVKIAANSRAALVLSNETILRIDQKSTISFPDSSKDNVSIIKLLRGVLHIFSHRPRSLKVVTPYVNGIVEGTEFLVRADPDQSIISVFEGLVTAINQYGHIQVASNQSVQAKKGQAPQYMAVVKSRENVDWTLYYPSIVSQYTPPATGTIKEDILKIEKLLFVGRATEARNALAKVLTEDPLNSDAYALSSIIETVGNNKDQALLLAQKGIQLNPESAASGLALSYAQQARFDLPAALQSLQQTAQANPQNSLVKARLAEILLSVGEDKKALATAKDAANTLPHTALSQSVLGFVHLSRIEIDEALNAFTRSLTLDPALPLARLGLGLAKIRLGNLEEGRAEIEIAAALAPGNSLIRSYLGKAYFEEKRDSLAQRQYEIAKDFDPADPTPWFYDALRKQSNNRPVEALHDLQKSIALNDNRAVYRSRLLLDDDLAARSASLGRIYTDLGFNQLAQLEGWKSVNKDPSNYSAQRFLADTYSTNPRHEITRVSALLKSMLLQPINVTPIQPRLAESNLTILNGGGPSASSFNEFNPLFFQDGLNFQASGVAASNDTLGDEVVLAGAEGRFSFSLGQLHYQTDGIRENNDQDQDIYSAFFQTMLTPATSVMAEIRHKEQESGDLRMLFDRTSFSNSLQQEDQTRSARLGVRHNLRPNSTFLATAIISSDKNDSSVGLDGFSLSLDFDNSADNKMAEIQHIFQGKNFNLQSGAGFMTADESEDIRLSPLDIPLWIKDFSTDHTNIYSYAEIQLPHNISTTIGLSGDILDSRVKERNELNPKFGLTWQPTEKTLIRAAVFRTVTRNLIYAQTIEPTTIAGFNQFIGDEEASASWTYGTGIDHSFSHDLHGGLQFYHRDFDVFQVQIESLSDYSIVDDDWKEDIASAYIYWAPSTWATFAMEYHYETMSRNHIEGTLEILKLETHRVTPSLHFFSKSGLSTEITANFVNQNGRLGEQADNMRDNDTFAVVDISASYRLPKRKGVIKVEVRNIFDEQFQFVDIDSTVPRFLPEQQIVASITVVF